MRGLCHKASSQPVCQLQCSLATGPNQHLFGRVLPPLVICAVGAHYEIGSSLFLTMGVGVTERAERDQVLFGVVARVTPKLLVMDLQV
jgi:hypothetical protein